MGPVLGTPESEALPGFCIISALWEDTSADLGKFLFTSVRE